MTPSSKLEESLGSEAYRIIKSLEEFKEAVKGDDNEMAHAHWDSILTLVIQKHQPKLWKKMKSIRKLMTFWYA